MHSPFRAAVLAVAEILRRMSMKKQIRLVLALVVLLAGSALASAPQFDGGAPHCLPGQECIPIN